MAKQIRVTPQCSFWSKAIKRCTANGKGLYIPYESHIAGYCTGPKYPLCRRYREEIQLLNDIVSTGGHNRRGHCRSKSRQRLLLHYVDHSGLVLRHTSTPASMIDYSDGGMQISCRQPLFSDTVVRIIYSPHDAKSKKEQLAMVRWCRYLDDSLQYYAGLKFASLDANSDERQNRSDSLSFPISGKNGHKSTQAGLPALYNPLG